ncbi:MAG: hypothetical protein QXS21_04770 [Thermoproteota archaeon]|nr:hypothetical protein [Candidatus Brockarchaeota archaeon]
MLKKMFFPILNLVTLVILPLILNYYITLNYKESLEQLETLTNISIRSSLMFITAIGIMITILSIAKSFSNKASFINLLSSLGMSLLWFLLLSFAISFGQFPDGLIGMSTIYIKTSPSMPLSEAIVVKFDFRFVMIFLALSLMFSMLSDTLSFKEGLKHK